MRLMLTVLVAGALLAAPAYAGSGSYRMLAAFERDYTTVIHGDSTYTAGTLSGSTTVLESSGAPFVENSHSTVECLVYLRRSAEGFDLEAPCIETDADGDELHGMSVRKAGDIDEGGGGKGRRVFTGGTGKYAGISGTCGYDTHYLPGDRLVSFYDCEWKTP